jgi:hypothetical protein
MAGLVPAIHAFARAQDVDARHKAGHDEAHMQSPSPGRTRVSGPPFGEG